MKVFRVEDPCRGDDSGDELWRGNIETRVDRRTSRIRDPNVGSSSRIGSSPSAANLCFASVLDGNGRSFFDLPIQCGKRDRDVEGDPMAFGEDGFRIGPDFVGHFTSPSECAIAAHDDQVDLPSLHEMARCIVGNDGV